MELLGMRVEWRSKPQTRPGANRAGTIDFFGASGLGSGRFSGRSEDFGVGENLTRRGDCSACSSGACEGTERRVVGLCEGAGSRSAGSWGCARVWGCGVAERRVVELCAGVGLWGRGALGRGVVRGCGVAGCGVAGMYRATGFVVLEGVFLGGGRVPGGLSFCSPDLFDKGVGFHHAEVRQKVKVLKISCEKVGEFAGYQVDFSEGG